MNNFELIDDYLTGKLRKEDIQSFEEQLSSDPALKAEVQLQKEIIQGLKTARVAELKSMLNNVVITAPTVYFSPARIAAGLIGTAVLATGLYFYFDKDQPINPIQVSSSIVDSIRQSEQSEQTHTPLKPDSIAVQKIETEAPVKSDNPPKTNNTVTPAVSNKNENKPTIDILDPTDELSSDKATSPLSTESKGTISVAKIDVNVVNSERKYKSHYQFSNGKLVLYGNFDNGLYEIIEVNGQQSRSLFMNYKTTYYLLDETRHEITPLKEISDPVLIQKLKAFQAN